MNDLIEFIIYPPTVMIATFLAILYRRSSNWDRNNEAMKRISKADANRVAGVATWSRIAYPLMATIAVVGAIGAIIDALIN